MSADPDFSEVPFPVRSSPVGPRPPGSRLEPDDEVNLFEVAGVLLRHRRATVGLPLVFGVVGVLVALLLPVRYTANVSFVPEESSSTNLPSNIAALAGQFGFSLGPGSSESPQFYATLLASDGISRRMLLSYFPDPRASAQPGDSVRLLTLLRVRGDSFADSLERGVRTLRKRVSVDVNAQTDVLRVEVSTHYPEISTAVANRYVEFLNLFNTQSRQSQARERRKFAETTRAEAEEALRRAEDNLKTFYERNRSWEQAPQLTFEEGRLRRQVDLRQDVYLTLTREYEKARIDEVNLTPVLTVVDPAQVPVRRSWPPRALLVAGCLGLGLVLGLGWAFGQDYVARVKALEPQRYQAFRALVDDSWSGLRRREPGRPAGPEDLR